MEFGDHNPVTAANNPSGYGWQFRNPPRYAEQDPNSPAEQYYRQHLAEQNAINNRAVSPALAELYKRRDTVRDQLKHYGESDLADQARSTGRTLAGVDINSAKRGLYSTTVHNAERNRAIESTSRDRAALQDQITQFKSDAENTLTGDIAKMLSDEEDRRQGYAYQVAQGRAASDAQTRSSMFGLAGMFGGGALAGFGAGGGSGGGGSSAGANYGYGGPTYGTGNPNTRYT